MGPLRAADFSAQGALGLGPRVQLEAHENVLISFEMESKKGLLGGRQCVNM